MDILILGGTGAMGTPLVEQLKIDKSNNLYVTSRRVIPSHENVHYIKGNAKESSFLKTLLHREYDAIFDFMVYGSNELADRLPDFLEHTKQYFFFSSSRVYAESEHPLTEDSLRLLDASKDELYLKTDEYALAKAREENLLFNNEKKNWTIIRPYITYNDYRLQLGVFEKENWLYRALQGRAIVLPKDIAEKKTALTYGPDVASAIIRLIGNEKAFGQAFHVVNPEVVCWKDILNIYLDVIQKKTGKRIEVKIIENSKSLQEIWNPWQIKYDRLFNRIFDSKKIEDVCGIYQYRKTKDGLSECLENFLDNPKWLNINWRYEAWADKNTGEFAKQNEICNIKTKAVYFKHRLFG